MTIPMTYNIGRVGWVAIRTEAWNTCNA